VTYEPTEDESDSLVLSDLINRVLDKGVVVRGEVIISVADVDLIALDLRLLLTAVRSSIKDPEPAERLPDDGYSPLLRRGDRGG
jgi:hypothetical protein